MLTNYEKKAVIEEHYPTIRRSFIKTIKRIIGPFLTRFKLKGNLSGILAFNSRKREDYEIFFQKVIGTCSSINRIEVTKGRCIRLDALKAYIGYFAESYNFEKIISDETLDSAYKPTFIDKILTVSNLVSNYCMVKDIYTTDFSGIKGCLVYCDTLPMEAALIEACNRKGIVTITCQHGINIPSDKIESFHQLNYRYVPSKIALVWGKKNKELIEMYNPQCECIVCGNPTITIESGLHCDDYIAVVGDIPENKKYNQIIISIAEKYARANNLRVIIRIHPTDNEENYHIDGAVSSYGKDIDKAEFILAHTTTMIFSYLIKGKKVFRLRSDIPYGLIDDSITFENVDELIALVDKSIDFKRIVKEQIQYCGDESTKKYEVYFNGICGI